MAKLTAPLLSMGARGQIGKSMVLANWRGVDYARQHVIPANPRTTAQTLTRNVFTSITRLWILMGVLAAAPWSAATKGKPLTNRNQFIKSNLKGFRDSVVPDNSSIVGSPGALGGFPGTALAAVTGVGAGEIDATLDLPDRPTDWTIASCTFVCWLQQDPGVIPTEPPTESSEAVAAPDVDSTSTLTVPTAGGNYYVTAWPVWTRPDGKTAYGPSLTSAVVASHA